MQLSWWDEAFPAALPGFESDFTQRNHGSCAFQAARYSKLVLVRVERAFSGELLAEVPLQVSEPIARLRAAAAEAAAVRPLQVQLIHCSAPLVDSQSAAGSGLKNGSVVQAVLRPPGALVLTASADSTAKLWDSSDGKCLETLDAHDFQVSAASFSPDGSEIITASLDGTSRLWRTEDKTCFKILDGRDYQVVSAVFSPDSKLVATCPLDNSVKIWCTETGTCRHALVGHRDVVLLAKCSPDGLWIATKSMDGTVKIWSSESGKCVQTLHCPGGEAGILNFSHDGSLLLTPGESHQQAKLWVRGDIVAATPDLYTPCGSLRGHLEQITMGAFSPSSSMIVTASVDCTGKLWYAGVTNEPTERCFGTLRGHTADVRCACFCPEGVHVATTSDDTTVRLWSIQDTVCLRVFAGHLAQVASVTFSPAGDLLLSASFDGTARLWRLEDGACTTVLRGHTGHVTSASFSP
eukprot:TRINITY_DN48082_c0_g1_i1.p1 TRINITY_DN48082_c0_g1~~TRINITY_DN48082_c0_g1_i1.p1  ORF type:complete len:472 (-),score=74.64 TRINITY_DN48082_c0_g1_i1:397-1791(-)